MRVLQASSSQTEVRPLRAQDRPRERRSSQVNGNAQPVLACGLRLQEAALLPGYGGNGLAISNAWPKLGLTGARIQFRNLNTDIRLYANSFERDADTPVAEIRCVRRQDLWNPKRKHATSGMLSPIDLETGENVIQRRSRDQGLSFSSTSTCILRDALRCFRKI